MQCRQGDVLLERVNAIPESAWSRPLALQRPLLVAPGRDGRRSHVLTDGSDVTAWAVTENSGDTPEYLVVGRAGARLIHEEHAPIDLAPGMYQIIRQHEFDPAVSGIRHVLD